MNVLLITDHPNFEDWDDPVSEDCGTAIEMAELRGVHTSQFYEGNLLRAVTNRKYDLCVLVSDAAGRMPPAWEQHCTQCIVVFPDRIELRQFERLEMGGTKYAIHTEVFPGAPSGKDIWELFFTYFYRQLAVDAVDVRKAIKMGLKACTLE